MKYRSDRANKDTGDSNNAADHVIKVEEMTKNHPFVKSVRHIAEINCPVVTLYTDQQIKDVKDSAVRKAELSLELIKHTILGNSM